MRAGLIYGSEVTLERGHRALFGVEFISRGAHSVFKVVAMGHGFDPHRHDSSTIL